MRRSADFYRTLLIECSWKHTNLTIRLGNEMGQAASQDLKSSSFQVSLLPNEVIESCGDVEAIGEMAVKIKSTKVSVPRPSKVFWVGVLLKKQGWIHTGVGLHNDITVNFGDGTTKKYEYLVAHGIPGKHDKKFKVYLSFANDLPSIHDRLAEALETEVDGSFSPVFAGDSWTTNRIAKNVVTHIEQFLGLELNMSSPGPYETNCVHFSVSTYLFFANRESDLSSILGKVGHLIRNKNFTALLNEIEFELNEVVPASHPSSDSDSDSDSYTDSYTGSYTDSYTGSCTGSHTGSYTGSNTGSYTDTD